MAALCLKIQNYLQNKILLKHLKLVCQLNKDFIKANKADPDEMLLKIRLLTWNAVCALITLINSH